MMKSSYEFHIAFLDGPGKFTCHIPFWTHPGSIPLRILCVLHRESVVMLCHRSGKASSSFLEKFGPLISMELLTCKHGDKIFIPGFLERAVGGFVIFSLRSFGIYIDAVCIPGGVWSLNRYSINPPMFINAELAIAESLWCVPVL
jgi:hypothetical protein